MSTATRRAYADALAEAEAFRALFPAHAYLRWEIAGSVRRKARDVGDVEHVILPAFTDMPGPGLFAEPERVNLILYHLDRIVVDGVCAKHVYGTSGFRWGEKYRGVDFHGYLHELFCADADNWGPTLAIRTGPAEFSKSLVTNLLNNRRRNHQGYVWRCDPCPRCGGRRDNLCQDCQGTNLKPIERLSVGDEKQYFELCGVTWREPEARR